MSTTDTTYAVVADLKPRLGPIAATSTTSDALLQSYLNAAAETVDAWTRGYRPGVDDSANRYEAFSSVIETRLFDDDGSGIIPIDDLLTITTLLRGTAEITSTYYKLDPINRRPAERILLRADAVLAIDLNSLWYGYPFAGVGPGQITITGAWGYCTSANRPAVVKEATLRLAAWAYEQEGVKPAEKMQALRDPTKPFYWEIDHLLKALKRGGGVRFA